MAAPSRPRRWTLFEPKPKPRRCGLNSRASRDEEPRRGRLAGVTGAVLVAFVAAQLLGIGHEERLLAGRRARAPVRVWRIEYRAHDGRLRAAFVDLPRWYGPRQDPPLPLIISPHGLEPLARASGAMWGDLPARGPFAVVNPDGVGRRLGQESWGAAGQIRDLARLPRILASALPWLRINRQRIYAFGGGMGGQEVLLLAARHPRLLAGVAAFDAPTDLAQRYRDFRRFAGGARLRRYMRIEVGGTPLERPAAYAARSPLSYARRLARSHVPIELWWSRRDTVVVDQNRQSGRLYRTIRRINRRAPVDEVIGAWQHTAELSVRGELPDALLDLGLLPLETFPHRAPATSQTRRSQRLAFTSLCARRTPSSYQWPLKPFHEQHPVRGYLGDPRTVFGLEGATDTAPSGSFSFHDGVDIVASPHEAVYPVVSGVVIESRPYTVVVRSSSRRSFQYWHIRPLVQVGAFVTAGRTVLGRVLARWGHVHFMMVADGRVRNPLSPGHLVPYEDSTAPFVRAVAFRTASGQPLRPSRLAGRVSIVALAFDSPALPVVGAWHGALVSPARLSWRLTASSGRPILRERGVFDFRRRLPAEHEFWHVYAHGSYQNFPAVGLHRFRGASGRYLFVLTRRPLQTKRLPAGVYRLTVTASDTCGNRGSLTERVGITSREPGSSRSLHGPSTQRTLERGVRRRRGGQR